MNSSDPENKKNICVVSFIFRSLPNKLSTSPKKEYMNMDGKILVFYSIVYCKEIHSQSFLFLVINFFYKKIESKEERIKVDCKLQSVNFIIFLVFNWSNT